MAVRALTIDFWNTMFSPGRVIRRLLEQHGLLPYFDAFVFSDETGFSKPDARWQDLPDMIHSFSA